MQLPLGYFQTSTSPTTSFTQVPPSISTMPTLRKSTFLIYAPGASTLLTSVGSILLKEDRCHIDRLVAQSSTGSIALNPWSDCQDEFLYLLGLDTKPSAMFPTAIHDIYPNTRIHVITPSNEFHVQATNLSVCSTLLAASSVSNPQLWAEVANACPTYFHSQPDDPFLNTITLLHVPCHCIRDVIQLNQCLPLLFLHQFTQTIFVSSWDVFHVSKQDHQHAIELASSLFLSSLQLAIPNSNVKELEASFQKCPPLTVLYHQPTFPPDSLQKFDVLEIFKHGSHGVIFSNRFLDTLGLHSCPLPSPITFSPPRDYDRIIR